MNAPRKLTPEEIKRAHRIGAIAWSIFTAIVIVIFVHGSITGSRFSDREGNPYHGSVYQVTNRLTGRQFYVGEDQRARYACMKPTIMVEKVQ